MWRWEVTNQTWSLYNDKTYCGSIRQCLKCSKWHMGLAGSNGPYTGSGYYQYVFADFETAKLKFEQRVGKVDGFCHEDECLGWDRYPDGCCK